MTDLHITPQHTTMKVRKRADGTVVGEVLNDSADTAKQLRLRKPEWHAMRRGVRTEWLLNSQDRTPKGGHR